jgi:hypothetical protein
MNHILSEVDEDTTLEVKAIISQNKHDIEEGDKFTIKSIRKKEKMPDGSVPDNQWIASASHSSSSFKGNIQLKSKDDYFSRVIIPSPSGGVRVELGR